MRYKLLGGSGLRVSELCLGTMAFGEEWGWGAPKEECRRIVEAFAEAGGNFIDTADKYTDGASERYVGELIAPERERWVLATKYTLARDLRDPNGAGNHRKSLVHALDASLKRLGTDFVDLLWLHMWDFATPVEEVVRALDDQVRAGKVLYVGISNTPAWIVSQAVTLADLRGWTPFVALQVEYSLVERTAEREFFPMARALDLALTAWSPLGAGVLTGKYSPGTEPSADTGRLGQSAMAAERFLSDRNLAIARVVAEVAAEAGATPAQVALAWVWARPGGAIPIVGVRSEAQLRDNLGALDLELTGEQLARLDASSRIELGYPHDFLAWTAPASFTFGDGYALLDNHRSERWIRASAGSRDANAAVGATDASPRAEP
jgi:aryl-alcohol dehydrogenase-like predicted oxidoreductase